MDKEHVTNAVIARGTVMPMHPEESGEAVSQIPEIYAADELEKMSA